MQWYDNKYITFSNYHYSKYLKLQACLCVLQWVDPGDAIDRDIRRKKKIELRLPQLIEIGRLAHYQHLPDLSEFAKQRESKGVARDFGVTVVCSNGAMLIHYGREDFSE